MGGRVVASQDIHSQAWGESEPGQEGIIIDGVQVKEEKWTRRG